MNQPTWQSRGKLLVPSEFSQRVEPAPAEVMDQGDAPESELEYTEVFDEPSQAERDVEHLTLQLETQRRSESVQAAHQLAGRRGALHYRVEETRISEAEAELDAQIRATKLDRKARIELENLRRATTTNGHTLRIKSQVIRSAEYRALRIEKVRRASMLVGGVVLTIMAVWSTAGVQAGFTRVLNLPAGSVGSLAAWIVEPALMSLVALVIVARSLLRTAGGKLLTAADYVEYGALATSIALNLASGTSGAGGEWDQLAACLAHSIGPVGAAATAYLIGVVDNSCTQSDPWEDSPTMEQLGLIATPQSSGANTQQTTSDQEKQVTPIKLGKLPDQGKQDTPIKLGKQLTSQADLDIYEAAMRALNRGELSHPVTASAIYRTVMARRGDRARSVRVAQALTA